MKKCNKCKESKSLEDFSKAQKSKDGRTAMCKLCLYTKRKEERKKDPERFAQYRKEYKKGNFDSYRETKLKNKFGVTLEWYDEKLAAQNNRCAICAAHVSVLSKNLAVDHCHTTGNVRGLLCAKCNLGIGILNDDINILQNAIEYLKKYSS